MTTLRLVLRSRRWGGANGRPGHERSVEGHRQRQPQHRPGRARRARAARGGGAHGARRGRRQLRRHPDAQRHRLHRGGLRRADARRLRGADQLALQGRGDRLHPRRLRRARADRPCRPARADCRRVAGRHRADCRVDAAGGGERLRLRAGAGERGIRRPRLRDVACAADALCGRDADAVAHHVLHLRHDWPPQGRAPPGAGPGADGRDRAPAPRRVRHRAGHPLRRAGPALPLRAQCVRHARRPRRRGHGADAALRSGRAAGAHRARAPRHHVHGADHVHPPAQAARGDAAPLRHLLAEVRHPRRGALPARGQAGDDRLVGAGDQRVLRLHRVRAR